MQPWDYKVASAVAMVFLAAVTLVLSANLNLARLGHNRIVEEHKLQTNPPKKSGEAATSLAPL